MACQSTDKKTVSYPVEITLKVMAGPWKILIIQQLLAQPKRFDRLQRELPGITDRTLTKQLLEMEAHKLVIRDDYRELPSRVGYRLSALGNSLKTVLNAMHDWAVKYGKQIIEDGQL